MGNQFFPSSTWALGVKLWLSAWQEDPSPTEQSCLLPFAFVSCVSVYDLCLWVFVYANVDTWMSAMTFM